MNREGVFFNKSEKEQTENLPREIEAKIVNLGDPEDFLERIKDLGAQLTNERRLLTDRVFKKPDMLSDNIDFSFNLDEVDDQDNFRRILSFLGVEITSRKDENDTILHPELEASQRMVRLRNDGDKLFLTVKEKRDDIQNIDNRVEMEMELPDDSDIVYLLNSIGYIQRTKKEKFRTSFELDGTKVEFNEGPVGPPWAEIEADSEEQVLVIAKKMGYGLDDLRGMSDIDYYVEYGPALSADDLEDMTFDRMKNKNN